MEIEFSQLFATAKRWWWLLIVGALIGGLLSYGVSNRTEPTYQASVILQVNAMEVDGVVDSNDLQTTETLASTYARLVWTHPVLDPVITSLGLSDNYDELSKRVSARSIVGSPMISVTVTGDDPQQVADIANAIGASFSAEIARQTVALDAPVRQQLNEQIIQVQDEISQVQGRIQTLEQSPGVSDVAIQREIGQLESRLGQLETNLADLTSRQQDLELRATAANGHVTVAVPAEPEIAPIGPGKSLVTAIGIVSGGLVAAAIILVIGLLDTTVKGFTDFPRLTGAPLLTRITGGPRFGLHNQALFMLKKPDGRAAESIRLLRTNLEYAAIEDDQRTIAICSPGFGEGKTTVAANLAIAAAQAGIETILVDADLRRPTIHKLFELKNETGLATWLQRPTQRTTNLLQRGPVANLSIFPAGPVPTHIADLLSIGRIETLLASLGDQADLVIIDTPSVLHASDALHIAVPADATIMVCQSGKTKAEDLRQAVGLLQSKDVSVMGVVLNRQPGRGSMLGDYLPVTTEGEHVAGPVRALPETVQPVG